MIRNLNKKFFINFLDKVILMEYNFKNVFYVNVYKMK